MTSASGSRPTRKAHAAKATAAHQAYSSEWKGLVRMVKYWNNNPKHGEKPVKPSFLIEVMALQCLHGGWGGSFDREMQGFFATLADRVSRRLARSGRPRPSDKRRYGCCTQGAGEGPSALRRDAKPRSR